jgi:hypothetical protein
MQRDVPAQASEGQGQRVLLDGMQRHGAAEGAAGTDMRDVQVDFPRQAVLAKKLLFAALFKSEAIPLRASAAAGAGQFATPGGEKTVTKKKEKAI